MTGASRPLAAAAVATVVLAVACRSAASVILDLPPPEPESQAFSQSPAPRLQAIQDTVRPPIEQTLDRDSVITLLPRDAVGNPDWVAAIRQGIVRPRRNLPGERQPESIPFGFDFYFRGPASLFDALFPHSSHTEWLDCSGCHPSVVRYTGDSVSMQLINEGESCGRCHGKVAFPTAACFRCHTSMPASGSAEPELWGDILFTRDSAAQAGVSYDPAVFPHWVHRIRYACSACHPNLFEMRAGSNSYSMDAMRAGEGCGRCHNGQDTFSTLECARCHLPPSEVEAAER